MNPVASLKAQATTGGVRATKPVGRDVVAAKLLLASWIVGDRCRPVPPGTHGSYVGATLVCDDGFRLINGRCENLHPR